MSLTHYFDRHEGFGSLQRNTSHPTTHWLTHTMYSSNVTEFSLELSLFFLIRNQLSLATLAFIKAFWLTISIQPEARLAYMYLSQGNTQYKTHSHTEQLLQLKVQTSMFELQWELRMSLFSVWTKKFSLVSEIMVMTHISSPVFVININSPYGFGQ